MEADEEFIQTNEKTRQQLGSETFQAAWERGQALTVEEGIALAMEVCKS
jgi:hypothetical protein